MKHTRIDPRFIAFGRWLKSPLEDKELKTQREWGLHHHISEQTLSAWKGQIEQTVDSDQEGEFMKTIYKLALEGKNPKYAEIWARLKGYFIEKQEIKHTFELSADEHLRIRREAERELREFHQATNGSAEMPKELPLLSGEVREDT